MVPLLHHLFPCARLVKDLNSHYHHHKPWMMLINCYNWCNIKWDGWWWHDWIINASESVIRCWCGCWWCQMPNDEANCVFCHVSAEQNLFAAWYAWLSSYCLANLTGIVLGIICLVPAMELDLVVLICNRTLFSVHENHIPEPNC